MKLKFTNVNIKTVIDIVNENWYCISTHTTLDKDRFLKLLAHSCNNGYFTFQGQFFKQSYGTATVSYTHLDVYKRQV